MAKIRKKSQKAIRIEILTLSLGSDPDIWTFLISLGHVM